MSCWQRFSMAERVRRLLLSLAICAIGCGARPSIAEAAIVKGLQEVVAGIFQLPLSTIVGTFQGPPIIGTLFGAANGLLGGVGLIAHGALELAASGAAVAKAAAPYVLPFVF